MSSSTTTLSWLADVTREQEMNPDRTVCRIPLPGCGHRLHRRVHAASDG
jgi:hypothetical protein